MPPSRRTTWLVATATAAAATAVPAFAGTAAAAPAAQRACNDNNDAQAVRSATYANLSIYLVYSPSCRTIWAKAVTPPPGNTGHGLSVDVIRSDGSSRHCNIGSGTACTTPHLSDAGYTSYAKGAVEGVNPQGGSNTTYFTTSSY